MAKKSTGKRTPPARAATRPTKPAKPARVAEAVKAPRGGAKKPTERARGVARPAKTGRPAGPDRTGRADEAGKAGKAGTAARGRKAAPARPGEPLVIVESPTKARTIGKYLGRGYTVKATVGHLRDLPTRKLGVEIDDAGSRFVPEYVTIKGKTQTLSEIKKAAKEASEVLLATDPDREGEAIAWHVASQLDGRVPARRILFHEITRDAIREAVRQPVEIDRAKVDAQQARRVLDRLVGYKASPILWRTIKTGLSAGRVQTVALRLLVEREREIRAFKPQEYWTIEAECEAGGQRFEAGLHKIEGKKPELHSATAAQAVVDAVRELPFVVTAVEKRKRTKRPGAPFTTSTLQQEAAKRLGFSSRRTMRAAQDLYEGVEIGEEGATGLITYMRTDSVRVSDTAIAAVRRFIGSSWDSRYLPEAPNAYSARKTARVQDAHE